MTILKVQNYLNTILLSEVANCLNIKSRYTILYTGQKKNFFWISKLYVWTSYLLQIFHVPTVFRNKYTCGGPTVLFSVNL